MKYSYNFFCFTRRMCYNSKKPETLVDKGFAHHFGILHHLLDVVTRYERNDSMKFNSKERRRMFHAVTHGGAVVTQSYINAEYDNGETEEFVRNVYINRPSILRKLIAGYHGFRFKYDIVQHFNPKDKIILSELER